MSDERLYTREKVSLIVCDRIKKLNARTEELELENSILKLHERMRELE